MKQTWYLIMLYIQALEVVIAEGNESLKEFINLRMGGFHTMCVFMAVIGKIYGDTGLRDLLIESSISTEEGLNKYYVESTTIMQCSLIYVFTKVYTV